MKGIILFTAIVLCISCANEAKENIQETATIKGDTLKKKMTVKCDSVQLRDLDPATGTETVTNVWRCDSEYVETGETKTK